MADTPPIPAPLIAGPAGYHGPGTDLGEDIRRGVVGRGPAPAPSPDRSREFGKGAGWGDRLRDGWHGLLRQPGSGPRGG
jgi:hypothetical protein